MASVELAESLSMAFLVLLERLSPVERAVFLLHEVFDFEYAAIARIVGKSEANCRQLVTRARKHLGARPRFEADAGHAAQLVERFTQAAGGGAVEDLVSLLAEDITLWADGGGKAPGAALKPVHGAEAVSRFVNGVIRKFVPPERVLLPGSVNGQPGFIVYAGGRPMAAMVFDIRAGRIHTIYAIGNPDKLRSIPPLSA
jgi:RNA polymerase sigma-70 factor, ECF subfamily